MTTRSNGWANADREAGDPRDSPPLAAVWRLQEYAAPGARVLARVAAGKSPQILEALARSSRPRQIRLATLLNAEGEGNGPDSPAEPGPEATALDQSLEDLEAAGAIEVTGSGWHRRITATAVGEELIGVHRAYTRWVRTALLSEEVDPILERSQKQVLVDAWEQGVLVALAGRSANASVIAADTGQSTATVSTLLSQLSLHGLVGRVNPGQRLGGPTWVLLREAKRAMVPLAAAMASECRIDPSRESDVTPALAGTLMRLALELLSAAHFTARPSGSYAMLCDLPGGDRTGWVGQFDGGEIYSIHPYRPGEAVDGGFTGTLEELLALIAMGHWRGVHSFGSHTRGGMALALAIAVALGGIQWSVA